MALVTEHGSQWYGVLPLPENVTPWVTENVVPHLSQDPYRSYDEFRRSFLNFISKYKNINLIADWHADIVHFFNLLGGKSHLETVFMPCTVELAKVPALDSAIPHNALSDALAIKAAYESIRPSLSAFVDRIEEASAVD